MKPKTPSKTPTQSAIRRALPLLMIAAVLGISLPSASAIGQRGKAWQNRATADNTSTPKKERTGLFSRIKKNSASKPKKATAPTANVASSRTTERKRLFSRLRDNKPATTSAKPKPKPTAKPQTVRVRATATAKPATTKKKRTRLLARIFKPDPSLNKKPAPTANVAVARKKQRPSGPVAPNPVQAPPKWNSGLLAQAKSRGSSVVINIASQRAKVYVGGQVALDTPVSTARKGKYTPRGSFSVGQRVRQGKISTIYKVEMPYWMRLGQSAYGMHAGYLPGYPASAGCIRMPYQAAQKMFDATGYGTRVRITGG